jgi:hypothetical protein
MYTGKRERPCCLCGDPETVRRLDLPPRAVTAMKHSGRLAWRDILGEVAIYFCRSDWETVRDLVLETGMNPIGRCNAARADFDLREDFEALTNDVRGRQDQRAKEAEMLADARETLADATDGDGYDAEERDLVEARVVQWTMEDVGAVDGSAAEDAPVGRRGDSGNGRNEPATGR